MRARGFTLVELMIVVAIIGILAVVGGTAYKRYGSKARSAEVYGMLAEFRAKEEAYRAEYSAYCNATTTCAAAPSNETPTSFFPQLYVDGSEPKPKTTLPITIRPAGWTSLGINPGKESLYCGYDAIAGNGPVGYAAIGPKGTALFASGPPTGVFWYVLATCDLDSIPATNSFWVTGQSTQAIVQYNEGS